MSCDRRPPGGGQSRGRRPAKAAAIENKGKASPKKITAKAVKSNPQVAGFTLGEIARIRAEGAPLHMIGTMIMNAVENVGYVSATMQADDGALFRAFALAGQADGLRWLREGDRVHVRGYETPLGVWCQASMLGIAVTAVLPVKGRA